MFCSQCGVKLNKKDRFCFQCGYRLKETDIGETDKLQQNEVVEPIRLVVAASLKKSIVNYVMITLIITDRRLIIAQYNNELMAKMLKETADSTKGLGILKRMGAQLSVGARYCERYYSMTVEEILCENADNFTFSYNDVTSVKVKLGGSYSSSDGGRQEEPTKITIVTPSNKYVVHVSDLKVKKQLSTLLSNIFRNSIKIKR